MVEMKAGRELDILVAERVMGYVPCDRWIIDPYRLKIVGIEAHDGHGDQKCYPRGYPDKWSTDWAAAGQVVERLAAKGWAFSIDYINGPEFYDVHIFPSADMETWTMERAKTAPHAISLAAVAATEAANV